MALEVLLDAHLNLTRSNAVLADWKEAGLALTQIGSRTLRQVINVTTSNVAIPIPAGTLGFCMIKNLDTGTGGSMSIVSAVAGVKFCRVDPGEVAVFKFGNDIIAPYIVTTNYTHQAEILILEL